MRHSSCNELPNTEPNFFVLLALLSITPTKERVKWRDGYFILAIILTKCSQAENKWSQNPHTASCRKERAIMSIAPRSLNPIWPKIIKHLWTRAIFRISCMKCPIIHFRNFHHSFSHPFYTKFVRVLATLLLESFPALIIHINCRLSDLKLKHHRIRDPTSPNMKIVMNYASQLQTCSSKVF